MNPQQQIIPADPFGTLDKASSAGALTKQLIDREKLGTIQDAHTPASIFIIEPISGDKVELQCVPELNYEPMIQLNSIGSVGRNNPIYHYTGAEDTLSFEVSWYSMEDSRQDVIRKCRWLESLAKNDGYDGPNLPVILEFGELFVYTKWLIASAGYRMNLFHKSRNMMPTLAYQSIVLKKISDYNTSRKEIQNVGTIKVEQPDLLEQYLYEPPSYGNILSI